MKNSLFKRVAAAAVAVPLALTQCLAFSSAAERIDAVQVGNSVQANNGQEVTLEKLLKIAPNATESNWNALIYAGLADKAGTSGEIDATEYADMIAEKASRSIAKTVSAFLKDNIVNTPIKYTITEDKKVVFTITVTQPDWNKSLAYTPQEALEALADANSVDALKKVDFSSVKLSGTIEITADTSDLFSNTDIPFNVTFKPDGEKEFTIGEFPAYSKGKIEELRVLGNKAIDENYVGPLAAYNADAHKKFNDKIDLIIDKIDRAERAMNRAANSSKTVSYSSVSDALTGANNFLKKKNINRQLPTTATGVASMNVVKSLFNNVVTALGGSANINITSEEIGQFIDSVESVNITANNKGGEFTGTFDDAEKDQVKAWVESQGYEYVNSYKTITSTVNFKGVDTFNVGDVDVKIKRILVTETTTTAETTTAPETTTTEAETTAAETTTTEGETTAPETTTTEAETTAPETTTTEAETTAPETTTTKGETTAPETTTTEGEITTAETTTTATDTTTPETTTTSYALTSSFKKQYVEVQSTEGFYFNTEKSFDKAQIQKVVLHTVYNEGYTDENGTLIVKREFESEPTDITDQVTFGSATPANTYKAVENKFDYQVALYLNNSALEDKDGKPATVTVYIGVKGDTDLNNIVDGRDATATLTYYAKTSTEGNDAASVVLSPSTLVNGDPASVYDDFAAFLSDIQVDAGKNLTRFAKKGERLVDGRDATDIIAFYAKSSTETYKDIAENDPEKLWNIVLGVES